MCVAVYHELEVSAETYAQPLPSAEDILMIVTEAGRNADKAGRVRTDFQISLETLKFGFREGYIAVYGSTVCRGKVHSYALEYPQ